ncbi:MAG: ABC transporter substrate-binding protein [Candidatus Omnitrophica bacterium]|nr:ABC transporter substrate-binding protein [Candidatus Omnitrophota bacterium]
MKKKIFLIFCITFFLFFLFQFTKWRPSWLALADDSVCETREGGRLVWPVTTGPKSFNPIVAKETSTTAITGLIFEGLTRTNGITQKVEPNLAKSWKISADGKIWTFYLREDVSWFDGEPFTADDVVFTFNQLIFNPEVETSSRDIFTVEGKTIEVERIDRLTVRFNLPTKFAPFLQAMSQNILPKHILAEVVKKGEFNYFWGINTKPDELVGTGLFKLKSYLPGERIVLEKNKKYWRKDKAGCRLPYLEEIIYVIVQNQDVALLKFLEGEIDYITVRGQDYPIVKPKELEGNFNIYNVGPVLSSNFLVFNQNQTINPKTGQTYISPKKLNWFKNEKFRKAVSYAIDRQAIIDIVFNGLGYRQYSPVSKSAGFFHNPNVKKYNHNPEKALKLLEEIGIQRENRKGVLKDKNGDKIKFNLFTSARNNQRRDIANIIRKDLEDIGMEVSFVPLAFNQIVAKLDSTYSWDLILIGLTGGIEPHFGKNVWSSSGHLHMWYPKQIEPETDWEVEIDKIFNQAVQILDRSQRKIFYDRWQEIVADKVPLIYTVQSANIFAIRDKFGNLKPTAYGGAFHNIEKIYIKK